MSRSEDLISFDLIEAQKENVQSLPGGRSAKALAAVLSPTGDRKFTEPTPDDTRSINDAVRAEYEAELQSIGEADDPLDIYDRYVKWTLNAYPSSQATQQSGLLPLLERATKAFLSSNQYKNDPRYLRLWLHYIRLFSDAPREIFAYLARHSIGESLALFYEEFAGWLEGAGRFAQAEEVYKLGLQREARPTERLLRKFGEFQVRLEQRPRSSDGPPSPALPTVRPALAAKIDPFAPSTNTPEDPQASSAPRGITGGTGATTRSGKPKMAIFSDADAGGAPETGAGLGRQTKGWESIGSIHERKKENTIEPKPWVGETLKTGKKTPASQKMAVFRDPSIIPQNPEPLPSNSVPHNEKDRVNARTGKIERVFVNLEAIYPDPKDPANEMSLEELRALSRGWMDKDWSEQRKDALKEISGNVPCKSPSDTITKNGISEKSLSTHLDEKLVISDQPYSAGDNPEGNEVYRDAKGEKSKKLKVKEVKGETQTVKTNLDSPTGPKMKRKNSSEPTMTFHTRAATDEIYSIFNQPLQSELDDKPESVYGSDYEEDDYTSAGESTATGRISGTNSEFGDELTGVGLEAHSDDLDRTGVSEWTEFSPDEHIPQLNHDNGENIPIQHSISTPAPSTTRSYSPSHSNMDDEEDDLLSPSSGSNKFVPVPPEDYHAPTGPYRDAFVAAQNRLPFMTPIIEQTESSLASIMKKEKGSLSSKTPSKMARSFVPTTPAIPEMDDLLLSSPFQDFTQENITQLSYDHADGSPSRAAKKLKPSPKKPIPVRHAVFTKSPIIREAQCNPMDQTIRETILSNVRPAVQTYPGYYNHGARTGEQASAIRKYFKSLARASRNSGGDKSPLVPPVLSFSGAARSYAVTTELGEGGFAPVYLAESVDSPDTFSSDSEQGSWASVQRNGRNLKPLRDANRKPLEAIKIETDPPSAWEFYMLRIAHERLLASGPYLRAANSIVQAHELHLFKNETFLVEEYRSQGTLIDLMNEVRSEGNGGAGTTDASLEESVVMFFAIELFRTVEALHACGIIHGDLKADNCLVRLEDQTPTPISLLGDDDGAIADDVDYSPTGAHGWHNKGLALIDFGRGIDMHAFTPSAQFIADWKVGSHECSEMRECRPWTYQVDLYGLAGTIYLMLFGKYMEVTPLANSNSENANNNSSNNNNTSSSGLGRAYRVKESLKRYWERELWSEVFDLCLNPTSSKWMGMERQHSTGTTTGAEEDASSAVLPPMIHSMKYVRQKMEVWLAMNAGRKGLSGQLSRLEGLVAKKRIKRGLA